MKVRIVIKPETSDTMAELVNAAKIFAGIGELFIEINLDPGLLDLCESLGLPARRCKRVKAGYRLESCA